MCGLTHVVTLTLTHTHTQTRKQTWHGIQNVSLTYNRSTEIHCHSNIKYIKYMHRHATIHFIETCTNTSLQFTIKVNLQKSGLFLIYQANSPRELKKLRDLLLHEHFLLKAYYSKITTYLNSSTHEVPLITNFCHAKLNLAIPTEAWL